jgi:flagellar protein FlgJ
MKTPDYSGRIESAQFNSHIKKLSQIAEKAEQSAASDQELKEATQEFESLFLHHLMKTMRSTVPKGELFHGGVNEDIYADMLDQEIAKVASQRGIGLAELLYQQLRRT